MINCRSLRLFLLLVLIGGESSARLVMHPGSKFKVTVPTWNLPGSTSLCLCRNQCLVQPACTAVSVQLNASGVQCAFTSEPEPESYLVNSGEGHAVFATSEATSLAAHETSSASTPTPSRTATEPTDLGQEFQTQQGTSSPPETSEITDPINILTLPDTASETSNAAFSDPSSLTN
ncbi:uncharacterized protein LOC125047732 [Penaeus chinensis]|uniref:uncharacterized protein LOC125047732 n=1 Tax=Penaeus chinensis TaxID=139456 RepID=UPI001FB6B742|nr:uncharacterized protein LOC125047732 [Penaeus chinensis]